MKSVPEDVRVRPPEFLIFVSGKYLIGGNLESRRPQTVLKCSYKETDGEDKELVREVTEDDHEEKDRRTVGEKKSN